MRVGFIVLRGFGYVGTLLAKYILGGTDHWWSWAAGVFIAGWGTWDQWKKPDDSQSVMARGVWVETLLILVLMVLWDNSQLLFLLLSPAIRTCIHLSKLSALSVVSVHAGCMWIGNVYFPAQTVWLFVQVGVLAASCLYASVIGSLLREREQMRRLLAVSAFEREQRGKEEERMRLAGQLHDVMGQYWASIVRALDVALALEGEKRLEFVGKARETAMQGLQEMRSIVRDWHDGRQTPKAWLEILDLSAQRLRQVTGIAVDSEMQEVAWNKIRFPNQAAEACARIGIEAMTNAVKHSETRRIRLRLHEQEGGLELLIADYGNGGLQRSDRSVGGMGMSTMHRLAQQNGGLLESMSQPGKGTTVRLYIPFQDSIEVHGA